MQIAAVHTYSEKETLDFAKGFAALLLPGDVVALRGDLGAGKTRFVQGLVEGLGGRPDEVGSPTFTLVHRYDTTPPLYHLDLYRLGEAEEEMIALGFEEYFEPRDAITAVEWAELAGSLLPPRRFDVALVHAAEGRRIKVRFIGAAGERHPKLAAFAEEWLQHPGSGEGTW